MVLTKNRLSAGFGPDPLARGAYPRPRSWEKEEDGRAVRGRNGEGSGGESEGEGRGRDGRKGMRKGYPSQ